MVHTMRLLISTSISGHIHNAAVILLVDLFESLIELQFL